MDNWLNSFSYHTLQDTEINYFNDTALITTGCFQMESNGEILDKPHIKYKSQHFTTVLPLFYKLRCTFCVYGALEGQFTRTV